MNTFGYLGDMMSEFAMAVCTMIVAIFALIPF